MGGQDEVLEAPQILTPGVEIVGEVVAVSGGLLGENIDGGTSNLAGAASLDEGGNIDNAAAASIDEVGAGLHLIELGARDHVAGLGQIGDVQTDKVGLLEELLEGWDLASGSQSHQGHHIVVDDIHTHGLSQDGQLRTNVTVTNNTCGPLALTSKLTVHGIIRTQSLSTNLPALRADLVPGSTVHLIGSIAELTSEGDDFGNDELGDTAGVGEGRVEDGDTMAGSVIEVDLVGTDTEAADDEQVLGLTEDLLGELRLGTDTDDLDFSVAIVTLAQMAG